MQGLRVRFSISASFFSFFFQEIIFFSNKLVFSLGFRERVLGLGSMGRRSTKGGGGSGGRSLPSLVQTGDKTL